MIDESLKKIIKKYKFEQDLENKKNLTGIICISFGNILEKLMDEMFLEIYKNSFPEDNISDIEREVSKRRKYSINLENIYNCISYFYGRVIKKKVQDNYNKYITRYYRRNNDLSSALTYINKRRNAFAHNFLTTSERNELLSKTEEREFKLAIKSLKKFFFQFEKVINKILK